MSDLGGSAKIEGGVFLHGGKLWSLYGLRRTGCCVSEACLAQSRSLPRYVKALFTPLLTRDGRHCQHDSMCSAWKDLFRMMHMIFSSGKAVGPRCVAQCRWCFGQTVRNDDAGRRGQDTRIMLCCET